jgi:zinc transport system substrate-binding protein
VFKPKFAFASELLYNFYCLSMKKSILILPLILAVLAASASGPGHADRLISAKIKIVTTIFPMMEFAKDVAGSRGEVHLLLPPGAEVHTWQPRASDILAISRADLLIIVGANLEPWLPGIVKSVANPGLITLDASQGLDLIKDQDDDSLGASDPHYWLDFSLDQKVVDRIRDLCCRLIPDEAGTFKQNALRLNQKLQDLDERFRKGLANCRQQDFVSGGHAAFGYLARRYGLKQISLYGLSPDSEPTPRELAKVISFAKNNKTRFIYYERSVSSKLAKMIASDAGAQMLVLSAAHNLTREQLLSGVTFFAVMEENLANLKKGLGCG